MFWWFLLFVIVLIIASIAWSFKGFRERIDVRGKSVFISGCDTGFGHGLALRLDRLGLKVYAGCLTPEGAAELRAKGSSQLVAIICDITKPDDIATAANIVGSTSPNGLWALVNNAGVAYTGEWDWYPEKYLRILMDINFFGHVAVTKAFLPQIKKAKGRIVNLSSVAGYISSETLGAYSCSKFAMEAFSDSLRREMRKWGVSVYIIEPSYSSTPMVLNAKTTIEKVWNDVPEHQKKEYGEEYADRLLNPRVPPIEPAELVIDVLESKIIHKNPMLRTRVGRVATFSYFMNFFLPTSWADNIFAFFFPRALPEVLKKK